jgi:hypothetical protein
MTKTLTYHILLGLSLSIAFLSLIRCSVVRIIVCKVGFSQCFMLIFFIHIIQVSHFLYLCFNFLRILLFKQYGFELHN